MVNLDRHAKSGEDMMEVLAHDIMRYETLSEPSDLFALASALVGNAPNDQYTVIELNVPAVFLPETSVCVLSQSVKIFMSDLVL
jgi:hypothetical protein